MKSFFYLLVALGLWGLNCTFDSSLLDSWGSLTPTDFSQELDLIEGDIVIDPTEDPDIDPVEESIEDPVLDLIEDSFDEETIEDPIEDPTDDEPAEEILTDLTEEEPPPDLVEEPAEDPILDPIQDPVEEELVEDPVIDPVEDPDIDPVDDPTEDPVEELVEDLIEDPIVDIEEEEIFVCIPSGQMECLNLGVDDDCDGATDEEDEWLYEGAVRWFQPCGNRDVRVDLQTGLTWRIDIARYNWDGADDYCANHLGGGGWFLPTTEDLETILFLGEEGRTVLLQDTFDNGAFNEFWSSSPGSYDDWMIVVDFVTESEYEDALEELHYVRCVLFSP